MGRYVCTKPCWHKKKKYNLGDIAEFTDDFPVHGKRHKEARKIAHFREISGGAVESPSLPGAVEVKVNSETRQVR